ncbi:uncharacterized protein LOC105162231 [Sesamum indicum]|uniref:Uncharacterized protein LOC105162231 n=1 Tax=Sesamum indicum TaxID=4182 RepID=A0A6I9T439_SESIN|nr:uncharacterized protein LOC105162231 [Sesamum indicum]
MDASDPSDYDFFKRLQDKLDEVMPWIGRYILAASAVCTLAMATDALNGIRSRKLWFPCKYFSLDATSLTILGVAMKLTVDLNTLLLMDSDALARLSSLFFMSAAMANFMSSLGSMKDKEILMNVVALGILVITIVVNIWIQVFQLESFYRGSTFVNDQMIPTILMLLLLIMFASSVITLPTSKKSLELKYQVMHKVAMTEEGMVKRGQGFRIDKRMINGMKKYWLMAETSNPQFVMARSILCTGSSVTCLFAALFFLFNFFPENLLEFREQIKSHSVYGDNTKWILLVQIIGTLVGTIVSLCRWFTAVRFKCLMTCHRISFREELKIEAHWIQTLVYWRDSFSDLQIQDNKCRRYLHDAKWFALTFLIGVQIMIVTVSKLLVLIPALLVTPFILFFKKLKAQLLSRLTTPNNDIRSESGGDTELNLNRFVLLLDGEAELPEKTLKNICRQADKVIEMGKEQQPQKLMHLLNRFGNFSGVREFDSFQVPSLHSQEPPNCWSLPIVTLTSIAISLPNIANNHKATQLMSNVSEGLSLVKLIEKTVYENDELLNIRNATEVSWAGVALYRMWQRIDLRRISLTCKSSKNVLQELSSNAERTMVDFKRTTNDILMDNPLNWPTNIIAANSMYRICQTILLSCQEGKEQTDDGLFERLSVMIADILAACFTNLPHVIITKCHSNAIEEREKSVHEAFLLLGKTGQIFELLQRQEWPYLNHDKAAYIEEWRASFLQSNDSPSTSSTSTDEAAKCLFLSAEQLNVMVE